ncbi:hypothetical protein RBWH47_01043 [Rhodopirellula baltica WH47]|uniref:Uncharacterized protein n=4 Tax=Rhodopirellula baltica TaxID=265606 RepID=Q7UX96_RHOBA|nr:hypothetical protein RBWH47_01043 [Rhodopirellula baltica WH47]ELP34657.1 hypothetical protein RBSWK_01368 [Rhodopirellula baltica SWK14]CAD72112.1 hypothetical protein RB1476 [Rhodopirellula baltica SH 1]
MTEVPFGMNCGDAPMKSRVRSPRDLTGEFQTVTLGCRREGVARDFAT